MGEIGIEYGIYVLWRTTYFNSGQNEMNVTTFGNLCHHNLEVISEQQIIDIIRICKLTNNAVSMMLNITFTSKSQIEGEEY